MKTIVALILACFTTALFGQAPPILRTPWTTNTTPNFGSASNTTLLDFTRFDPSGNTWVFYDQGADVFVFSNAFHATSIRLAGGNIMDANGNLYVTNSTGIDGGGGSGISTLNGTGTNLSAQYLTGSTNWPFVVRGTNGAMIGGVDTNANLWIGAGTISNNTSVGSIDIIPTNGSAFTSFKLHLSGVGNKIGSGNPVNGAALDVPGTVYVGTFNGTNADILGPIGSTLSPIFHAGTNSDNGLTVNTNGNVGIGTNAPNSALHVGNGGNLQVDGNITNQTRVIGGWGTSSATAYSFTNKNNYGMAYGSAGDTVDFYNAGSLPLRLFSDIVQTATVRPNTAATYDSGAASLPWRHHYAASHYYPSNTLTAAQVLANMTNGGSWIGMISNQLQIASMTNNAAFWKVIWP